MRKQLMKLATLPALALTLVLWSCDSLGDPTEHLVGPQPTASTLLGLTSNGMTVVKEKDMTAGAVTGVVGSGGGRLVLGKHELLIPKDAVSEATTFTMAKVDGDQIRVKLTATRLVLNDVGSQGFAVPVKLTLSYEDAVELKQHESLLRIVWIPLFGGPVTQASEVNVTGKKVSADLGHFSDYALAFP